jgi:hypothetical protein
LLKSYLWYIMPYNRLNSFVLISTENKKNYYEQIISSDFAIKNWKDKDIQILRRWCC